MSENTNPVDEKLEKAAQALSYENFMASHGGKLSKEQFTNIANVIPSTRATFPGYSAGFVQQPLIGTILAPEIVASPDGLEIASYPVFGKERFYAETDVVAINSGRKFADFGVTWVSAQLDAHAQDAIVDIRLQRAFAASSIDSSVEALELVRAKVQLGKEKEIAAMVRLQSNYDATGSNSYAACSSTTSWGNSAATPIETINAAKETVRSKCGMYPNLMWLSPLAFRYLSTNPEVKAVIKYGGSPDAPAAAASLQGLESLFGMQVVVGASISTATMNGAWGDVWGTDAGLMVTSAPNLHSPKFAATFTSVGSPKVLPPYLDRKVGAEGSFLYTYVDYYKPFITMPTAGFLFETAGTVS